MTPHRNEGARRRAQQQELIRRMLAVEPELAVLDETVPDDVTVAPAHDAPVSAAVDAEQPTGAQVDHGDAVMALLVELNTPMSVPDLVEWLEESAIEADEAEVRAALNALVPRVSVVENLWTVAPTHLDDSQQAVAFADLSARAIVVAPPGAGKTEVACARVAHAVNSGVNARSIVLVSFTRAATAELKERVSKLAHGGTDAIRGVEIRTLDSLAWILQRNLTEDQLLTGSYTDNIDRCIELLSEPPEELREYFDSIRLLVIDEAQDIVGTRSELAVRLISNLAPAAGVTVFADPAQAIYGDWALDEGRSHGEDPPLHERISAGELGSFEQMELTGSHRTTDSTLLGIAEDLRNFALVRDMTGFEAREGIKDELVERAGIGVVRGSEFAPLIDETVASQFFLFRTHGEVIQLSSYLSEAAIVHRLRFPGLPKPVYPWIGRLLGEWEGRTMRHPQFEELWQGRVSATLFDTGEPDAGWKSLVDIAGDDRGRLDVLHLREILARRNPPDEVLRPTLGDRGPVIGTVHGSKGREAEDVILGLTATAREADDAEEARVLYVGATRAKQRLRIAETSGRYGYLQSRRVWSHMNSMCAKGVRLEFGLEGDVDPISPVDRAIVSDPESRQLQDWFADVHSPGPHVYWQTERDLGYRRLIRCADDDRVVGMVGKGVESDMWNLGRMFGSNLVPGDYQRYLHVVDYTTVARDDDSPDLNRVTETYARSGFWVAPLVKGFSGICLRYGGKRSW